MNVAFVELEPAVETGFEDVDLLRDFVAVEAHARLKPQGVARAEAAGANAEVFSSFEQRVPHLHGGGFVRRDVDLEAVFAGVAGARDEDVGNAGDCSPREPVILDRGEIDLGELGERFKRARALQRELRVVGRVVGEVNAGPAADLLLDPGVVLVGGAGVDDEQVVVVAEAVDENVVDECALGREQRGVVGLVVGEARGVVHGDVLDGGESAGAAKLNFAHVRHVKEADGGADGEVLGDEARRPGPGYSTGMSQPPKSTILALSARCVALSAVFLSGAGGCGESDMRLPIRAGCVPFHHRDCGAAGSMLRERFRAPAAN